MHRAIVILPFAFAAQALAEQNTTSDAMDSLVGKLLTKLADRLFDHGNDMDDTTLGKPGTLAVPQNSKVSSIPSYGVARSRVTPPAAMSKRFPSASHVVTHRTTSGASAITHGAAHSARSVSVKVVDTDCNPDKQVCTAEAGKPHGGNLVSTYVKSDEERKSLISQCSATIELSERQACDVASLITGAFSPLTGFMKKADYESVVDNMRLADGTLMGLPVVLDISEANLQGKKVLLKYQGTDMAVMDVEEEWEPNKAKEAEKCYGTSGEDHPSVSELMNNLGKYYAGGKVYGLLQGYDVIWGEGFKTPAEVRSTLPEGKQVVAFQNRNPVHKAHFELLVAAKEDVPNSIVFVHPTCGPTQPGDIDGPTRIKTYEVLQEDPFYKKWAGDAFRWSYLPYSMKMAGPREAIQHMIIRKNFGATHFIIGRDMAGTKSTETGDDFYGPFDAQAMGEKHADELAMKVAKYENMVYVGDKGNARGFTTEPDAKERGLDIAKLSGTKFRNALRSGEDVPDWFAFPAVVKTLQDGGDSIFVKEPSK
jgi:sulfate adenylyltransferase